MARKEASLIIGNGLIASALAPYFKDQQDSILFASGVSNSNETRMSEFEREAILLEQQLRRGLPLLYFSSCGASDPVESNRPYIRHKLRMEGLVAAIPTGRVVRLPQVVGSPTNPHTLTNYLRDRILREEHFSIWAQAERNLIDIDDAAAIIADLHADWPSEERIVNVASEISLPILKIVELMEKALGKKAIFTTEQRGHTMVVDSSLAVLVGRKLGIDLGEGYSEQVIDKYYGSIK